MKLTLDDPINTNEIRLVEQVDERLVEKELTHRITAALRVLEGITLLPDAGMHGPGCWRRHVDCLALRVGAILREEVPDAYPSR